jgi:cell division septum initiation protein DivIVA
VDPKPVTDMITKSITQKNPHTNDELNILQMKLLCNLDLVNQSKAEEEKKIAAAKLHEIYRDGLHHHPIDIWQAKIYADIAGIPFETPNTMLKSSNFYWLYRIYDRTRLFILRDYHLIDSAGSSIFNFLSLPLPFFGLAGNFIRLCADTAACLSPFFNATTTEAALPWKAKLSSQWQRCKTTFNEGDRRKRMFNDLPWFLLSLLSIVLAVPTFGVSVLVFHAMFIGGYAWDVINETAELKKVTNYSAYASEIEKDLHQLHNRKKDIELQLAELKSKLKNMTHHVSKDELWAHIEKTKSEAIQKEISSLKTELHSLDEKIEKKNGIKLALNQKIKTENRAIAHNVLSAVLILTGSILLFFPPTSAIGLTMIIGSAITLAGGSIFNGFGKMIFENIKAWFTAKPKAMIEIKPLTHNVEDLHKEKQANFSSTASLMNQGIAKTTGEDFDSESEDEATSLLQSHSLIRIASATDSAYSSGSEHEYSSTRSFTSSPSPH